MNCHDSGPLELEHVQAARAITYRNENGLPLDSEVEGAAPRDRRFRALTVHVYRVHRAPKGRSESPIPPTRLPFSARAASPFPAVSLSHHVPSCPAADRLHPPPPFSSASSSAYHLPRTPQDLNPTEGAVGECIVLLAVGIVLACTILASGQHARLLRAAAAAGTLCSARATGSCGACFCGRNWHGKHVGVAG